jgi:hypothetical protein
MDAFGGGQTTPANRDDLSRLIGIVTDQFGNGVAGQRVTWTVESGPVSFLTIMDTTDAIGLTFALVEPTGAEGPAIVRASLPGGTLSVTFPLTILPREYDVILDRNVFRSVQNGTRGPAVDTIPLGETMNWTLDPFDYDNHRLISVGSLSFGDQEFPYANPSTVSVRFTQPGTYRYADFYNPSDRGVIVVR